MLGIPPQAVVQSEIPEQLPRILNEERNILVLDIGGARLIKGLALRCGAVLEVKEERADDAGSRWA